MPLRAPRRTLSASIALTSLMLAVGLSGCGKTESSASLMADAKQYQQKGDNKAALIQLKNAAAKNPQDGEVRFELAKLYGELNEQVSAEKEIRKAMSLGIDVARTAPVLAKTLLVQGKAQAALDETASAKAAPELSALRGEAFLATKQADKAKESFDSSLQAQPGNVNALLGMARYSLATKDTDAANRYIDEAVVKNPASADALMLKAASQRAYGKLDLATATYDQVLKAHPGHFLARVERANLAITARRYDAAQADITSAKAAAPNSLAVLYLQALLDYTQGKMAPALEGLQKVLSTAPEDRRSLLLAGSAEFSLGRYEQAERHLRKVIELEPKNPDARQALAALLLKVQRPAEAMTVIAPLLAEGGDNGRILTLAGQAQLQLRQFAKATEYFEKASVLLPKAAPLHNAMAISKFGLGDNDSAIRELETATRLDPASLDSGIMLGMAELRLHHADKAMAAAKALEKTQPNEPGVHNLKGGIYVEMGDSANAVASFEKALALQPTYYPAAENLAHLAMTDKKPELAKKRLESFLEKNKKSWPAMSALASLEMSQGHQPQATTWLERANTENPDEIAPVLALATHYLRIGQPQKAQAITTKYLVANPANADLVDLLGQAQLAGNNKEGALESYSKLVNLAPTSAVAQFRLATTHLMLKNEAAAELDLNKALALQPTYSDALVLQARIALKKGNTAAALANARQLQKTAATSAVGHLLEGDIQMALKKPELAIDHYKRVYAAAKSAAVLIQLHQATLLAGKDQQAGELIAQWQKEHPGDRVVPMYLAEASLAKNQFKVAGGMYEAILAQDPKNIEALNNLAWAYQKLNDPRALPTAEAAYKLSGDRPQIMDTLGWMLVQQGNAGRGLPLLQKAVDLAPQDRTIRFHLASGLTKSGDKTQAKKQLEQIVAAGNDFAQIDEARAMLKSL